MAERFVYDPLPGPGWMRILRLHKSDKGSGDIFCWLEPVDLNRPAGKNAPLPFYEALSHRWGNVQETRTIFCHGAQLLIPGSLFAALQYLRSSNHQSLWVDCICINQGDVKERSEQIQLITQIFNSATRVLAWLGGKNLQEPPGIPLKGQVDAEPSSQPNNDGIPSLQRYLASPLFRRVWTCQEFVLSRQVTFLLDHEEVRWETFWHRASAELSRHSGKLKDPPRAVQPALRLYTVAVTSRFLVSLDSDPISEWGALDLGLPRKAVDFFASILRFFSTLDVSDPRDRIYALSWLLPSQGIKIPVPDYSKSVHAVFQETRQALNPLTKSLEQVNPFPSYRVLLPPRLSYFCPGQVFYTENHSPACYHQKSFKLPCDLQALIR